MVNSKILKSVLRFDVWILFALGSAFFAGLTSVVAKCGIKKTDSTVATAIRTGVVLICSAVMVTIVGSWGGITNVDTKSRIFLVLSGITTGASWLCYFKAISIGDVNKVVPLDKSSTVLAAVIAVIFLGESVTAPKITGLIAVTVGTYMMIGKKDGAGEKKRGLGWFFYGSLSAVFAALTSVLAKVGIENVDSNLATTVRTAVVLVMAWLTVLVTGKGKLVKETTKKELLFIVISGILTGASWLCYYRALQLGEVSVVVPIDKLSILVSVAFSYIVFKEKLTLKSFMGLMIIVVGTLCLLL